MAYQGFISCLVKSVFLICSWICPGIDSCNRSPSILYFWCPIGLEITCWTFCIQLPSWKSRQSIHILFGQICYTAYLDARKGMKCNCIQLIWGLVIYASSAYTCQNSRLPEVKEVFRINCMYFFFTNSLGTINHAYYQLGNSEMSSKI